MAYMVTVVCPTYNHEKYIAQTLEGFLRQKTTFPVEYIIRDDASTDKTADILREYEQKYPGIFTIIYETENQYSKNITPAFSTRVFNNTQSKYVAICEGDDYWTDPEKLQKQVMIMEENEDITLCLHAHYMLNDQTGKIKTCNPFHKTGMVLLKDVFLEPDGMPATCSMLMRTNAIQEYPSSTLHSPVGDRNRRMFLAHKGNVFYFSEPMSVYRVNNSSSFGGRLYDYEHSVALVSRMNDFFDRFNAYTDYQYDSYIGLLKEREFISHYTRFNEYEKIVKTGYFKKCFSKKAKLKLFLKWKFSKIYELYKRKNRYSF